MYEMHFFFKNIKERFPGAILMALIATGLFFGAGLVLEDAELVQVFIAISGVCLSILYLIAGMSVAIYTTSMILLYGAMELLPEPWGLKVFVGLIVVLVIRKKIMKELTKKKLLEEHDDMSKAKAKEIIATMSADNRGAHNPAYQEAYLTMEAGFLMVNTNSKQYLLAIGDEDFTLYYFNQPKRIQNLVTGDTEIQPDKRDIKIYRNHITSIKLYSKKRFKLNILHLMLSVNGREESYQVTGGLSARQVENFFAKKHNIEVENQVDINLKSVVDISDVVEDIIDADEETIGQMRSSRLKNRFMIILSLISISFVLLGLRFPILYNLLILWPFIITIFYIIHQEYIQLDGSRAGKPSVWSSYLMNPILSSALSWYIILEILDCVCPFRNYTPWLVGLMGTIAFFVITLVYIKEFKGKIAAKLSLAFLALAYGTQIAAVISFRIHFGLSTLFSL